MTERRTQEEMKENGMKKEKYETCIHAEKVGQYAVFVTPGCPRANMIKGRLVSSKDRCRGCRSWEDRGVAEQQ